MTAPMIDSAILIDYIAGKEEALRAVQDARRGGPLRTHTIAAAEVLEGALNKSDLRLLDQVLAGLRLVPPSREDSFASLQILRTHGLRVGIEWPDCIIAATCLRLNAPVLTRNEKHFSAVRGLRVIRPY